MRGFTFLAVTLTALSFNRQRGFQSLLIDPAPPKQIEKTGLQKPTQTEQRPDTHKPKYWTPTDPPVSISIARQASQFSVEIETELSVTRSERLGDLRSIFFDVGAGYRFRGQTES